MLAEYFHPFAHGGSEWSVYYLAQALIQQGHKVIVLSPNYGTKTREVWEGLTISRFWFPLKIDPQQPKSLSPFWINNLLFFGLVVINIIRLLKTEEIDVIHVQSKSMLPGAILVKWLTGTPVVVTLRDYFLLCPNGACLTKDRNYRSCDVKYLLTKELPEYYKDYVINPIWWKKAFHFMAAVNARITSFVLRWFLKFADRVICISLKEQLIFEQNGITNTRMIYNLFSEPKAASRRTNEQNILFVGRLTPGKGFDLFLEACRGLTSEKTLRIQIIGDGFLKNLMTSQKDKHRQIILLGQIPHAQTLEYLAQAQVVVVPSRWEEPFGRTALEALMLGVPVVVTNRGGLPEIVTDQRTGYIVEPTISDLKRAIGLALKHNGVLRKQILVDMPKLSHIFYTRPLLQHVSLYKELCYPKSNQ